MFNFALFRMFFELFNHRGSSDAIKKLLLLCEIICGIEEYRVQEMETEQRNVNRLTIGEGTIKEVIKVLQLT